MEMTQEFFALFFISLGQAERAERWRREPQKVPEDYDDNLDLGGGEDINVVQDRGVVNEDFDGVEMIEALCVVPCSNVDTNTLKKLITI